ncbi:MAG: chloride channel protein [Halobacteriovoraceae bacterium]|jgi:chloride channel protein, CIC family|nr:chloride channel protein [Halobacteriovoraceae bacterium]
MKNIQKFKLSFVGKFLKTKLTEERTYFGLTLLTGVLAAVVTVSFEYLIHHITELIGTNIAFTKSSFFWGGTLIFISGFLTTRFFKSTAGSGVPNVKLALAVNHGKIPLKDTIAKYVTTVLSLSSGISLGKEGPVVTISSGIGSALGTFFHLSKKRVKALVAVGSAGGIAAAFNTPISAVVFTMEEVVGDLNAKVLGPIIISSVAAAVTGQALMGDRVMFSQLFYKLNDTRELLVYLFIGIMAAVLGPLWMKTTLKLRIISRQVLKTHRLSLIMLAFFLVGGLSLIHPAVLGSGHGFLEKQLLSQILDWKVLGVLFVIKFLATSVCYSSGPSGGLFMPTLLVGATLGSLIGTIAHSLFPEIISTSIGAYALVGMGAYFATIIRAPFTSILIVFELTRDYNIILPVMIANVAAYMLSEKITNGSIYEQISEQDGIHLPTRDDDEVLEALHVEDAFVRDVFSFNHDNSVKDAYLKLRDSDLSGFPVLKFGKLFGVVAKSDIMTEMAKKNHTKKLSEICEKKIIKIYPDQSLLIAFHRLKRFQISRLPVVSRLDDTRLIGIITAQDIVKLFGHQLMVDKQKIQLEEEFEL